MAFEDFLDSVAQVWRPTQGRGDFAEVVDVFTLVSTTDAVLVLPKIRLGDPGPGEKPDGRVVMGMPATAVVTERDVVKLLSGPEAPSRWRVVSPPAFPREHHYELVVEPWKGPLPGDDAEGGS